MGTDTVFHVRKVSLGLKRKYRVSADAGGRPGDLRAYAEKQLKVADEIVLYRDEQRTERLATVRESRAGFLTSLTGFEVRDGQDRALGSFGVLVRPSVQRSTWQLEQPGVGRLVGTERSLRTARGRRLIGLANATVGQFVNALAKYHFDFWRDGQLMCSIEKPKVFDDWYRITVHDPALDRTLLFALAITMETRLRP